MKIVSPYFHPRVQLAILLAGIAILLVLSFLPDAHLAAISPETRFAEMSTHGLKIVPASCASGGAYYYHTTMAQATNNTQGYMLPPGSVEHGFTATFGANTYYVCASNTSASQTFFFPANSEAEVQALKNINTSVQGVTVWHTP